jgi:beta-glucanase (GH16 family)
MSARTLLSRPARTRGLRAAALAGVALGALCISTGPALARPAAAARVPAARSVRTTDACGAITYKANGTPWTCTFDDEFDGRSLDTTKWTAWNGVNYWDQANVCYYSDPTHLTERNGTLNLSVTRLGSTATCQTPDGTSKPAYGAAVVHTKGHFSQAQGRWAARIKFAGGTGVHNDFWLYPDGNAAPGTGEIDVAEAWGSWPNLMNGATHVANTTGADVGGWGPCTVTGWSNSFHTYEVDWTATTVSFVYDGSPCYSYAIPTSGLTDPAAFAQKYFAILQVLVDDGTSTPAPDSSTAFPATMQVDWVHVWS